MAEVGVIVVSVLATIFFIALCVSICLFLKAKLRYKRILSKKLTLMKEIKHNLNDVKVQNNELTQQLEILEEKTGTHIDDLTGYVMPKKKKEKSENNLNRSVEYFDNNNNCNHKENEDDICNDDAYDKKHNEKKRSHDEKHKKKDEDNNNNTNENNNGNNVNKNACEEIVLLTQRKEKRKQFTQELHKLDLTVNQLQNIVESLLNESEKQSYCLQNFNAEQIKMQEHMQSLADEMSKNKNTREIIKIQSHQSELANHLQLLQQQNLTKENALVALKNELLNLRRSNIINNVSIENADSGEIIPARKCRIAKEWDRIESDDRQNYTHKCSREDSLPVSSLDKFPILKTYTISKPFFNGGNDAKSTDEMEDCLNRIRVLASNSNNYPLSSSCYISPPLSTSSTIVGLSGGTSSHSPKISSFGSNSFRDMRGIGKDIHVWKSSWRTKYV